MNGILIGITAPKGRGKTTLAQLLADQIPGLQVVGFADALKHDVLQLVNEYLGLDPAEYTREDLEDNKGAVWGPILQGFGELMRRRENDEYWIRRLEERLPSRAAVADVRYLNEAQWIKGSGGFLIAIEGPCRLDGDVRDNAHPSEANIQDCMDRAHAFVVNDGTLNDLRLSALAIAQLLKTRMGVA